MSNTNRLRQEDIWKLAAEAHRDPTTVRRVLAGKSTALSKAAVIDAAQRLNIQLPSSLESEVSGRIRAT
jgi:hypothetical protein